MHGQLVETKKEFNRKKLSKSMDRNFAIPEIILANMGKANKFEFLGTFKFFS